MVSGLQTGPWDHLASTLHSNHDWITSLMDDSGADDLEILGDCHAPADAPRGVVLIVHGFLGYKDYGMFPSLARAFAAAGFIAHRFNLSHSGMTNNFDTFERPDLFERDTWRKQVDDVCAVVDAVHNGRLAGRGLPIAFFGHSRGGDTSLLAAAELGDRESSLTPSAVVTAAAPSALCRMDRATREMLLRDGFVETRSNRTGQVLRIGRAWLSEQESDPQWHDLLGRVASIRCPLLFIHGESDPTVPASDADELAHAARSSGTDRAIDVVKVGGANHVFNVPNPLPNDQPLPETFVQLSAAAIEFVSTYLLKPDSDAQR